MGDLNQRRPSKANPAPERIELRRIALAAGQTVNNKALQNIQAWGRRHEDRAAVTEVCHILDIDPQTGEFNANALEPEPADPSHLPSPPPQTRAYGGRGRASGRISGTRTPH